MLTKLQAVLDRAVDASEWAFGRTDNLPSNRISTYCVSCHDLVSYRYATLNDDVWIVCAFCRQPDGA